MGNIVLRVLLVSKIPDFVIGIGRPARRTKDLLN